MDETNAAVGGEGGKAPAPAEPAVGSAELRPGAPAPEEPNASPRRERGEDAKYAAARRRAEAERDAAIRRLETERQTEQTALEEERRRTQDERARLVADGQLREIAALDGAVQSMDDLLAMPDYDRFYGLVKKGVSMVEAYKLTHYDALVQRAADLAAKQTTQSLASRQHMGALAGGAGSGDFVSVPAEVAAQFRLAKPGITDTEIRRKYRRYQTYKRQ